MLGRGTAGVREARRGSVPKRSGDGARHARAGDRADHRARREGAATWRTRRVEPIVITAFLHPPSERGEERRAELGGDARGERRAPGARAPCPRRGCPRGTPRASRTTRARSRPRRRSRRRPAAAMNASASPTSCGKSVARADGVGVDDGVVVAAEDEQRERGRVAPDRRLGLGGSELERPARGLLGSRPVAGEDERLHRADRPAPAPRRERRRCSRGSARRRGATTRTPRRGRPAISSASPAPPAAFPIRVSCRWRASGIVRAGAPRRPRSEPPRARRARPSRSRAGR